VSAVRENSTIEAGFDHKTGLGDLDDYPMYFNATGGIPEGAFGEYFPALAVGAYDIGTKKNATNYNIVYGKAAKTFKAGDFDLGRVSAGYFYGNDKLLLDQDGNKDNDGFFGAWEGRTMSEISDKLWIWVNTRVRTALTAAGTSAVRGSSPTTSRCSSVSTVITTGTSPIRLRFSLT
jgi:hypothetical protein